MASSSSSGRRQANTSEESQESSTTFTSSSSVESVIDSTTRGRLGFPSPLPPHRPLRDEQPDTSLPENTQSEVLSKVGQLMKNRSLTWRTMVFLSRQASAQAILKCPTVWIDAPLPEDDSWYIILRDIRDYLSRIIPQMIAIELIDMSFFAPPLHIPVEQSHPIVPVWDRLVDDIITYLSNPLWSIISGVRRGHEDSVKPVTIVIASARPSELEQYGPIIMKRTREYGLTDIKVVFLEVEDLFSNGNDTRDLEKIPPSDSYVTSKALCMGTSLGIKDNITSNGTIGGHIILTHGSEKYNLGVTNCHVVSIEREHNIPPITPYEITPSRVQLMSPSDFDHQHWGDKFCKAVEVAADQLEWFTLKYGTEDLDRKRQETLKNLQSAFSIHKKQAELYSTLVRNIGPVFSKSGFVERNGRASDWALLRLPSDRLFDNKLPAQEDLIRGGIKELQPELAKFGYIEEVGDMIPGTQIFKTGRTSGLTFGTVHCLEPRFQMRANIKTRAYQVTNLGSSNNSMKGDSGSWVIDLNGRWVGLIFAAPHLSLSGDAYILPARDVIEDIESVTGGKVSLP